MGTNYYLKATRPREVYDEVHIAKCSSGWKPSFQASDETEFTPAVNSVDDMQRLAESGEWSIVNEYGEALSWEEFSEEVLNWESEFNYRTHLDTGLHTYRDPQGYEFIKDWYQ